MVTDSAGITIIENGEGSWTAETRWRVGSEPRVRFGADDSAPEAMLSQIRDLIVAEDDIVVADQDRSIRMFDHSGNLLRQVGRHGSGPGEFQDILFVNQARGDSLVVYDPVSIRASIFAPDGAFGRVMSVPWSMPPLLLYQATRNMRFAAVTMPSVAENPRSEGRWGEVDVVVLDPEFQDVIRLVTTIWSKCSMEYEERCSPERGTLSGSLGIGPDGIYVGPADVPEIMSFSEDGRLKTLMRARSLDGFGFSRLLVDPVGFIWGKRWHADEWAVFDLDGRLLGVLDMPAQFSLEGVGDESVTGISRDSLGVNTIEVRRLHR